MKTLPFHGGLAVALMLTLIPQLSAEESRVTVFRPQDARPFQKQGLKTEVIQEPRRPAQSLEPSDEGLQNWPDPTKRMDVLKKIPELEQAAKKLGWDEFEMDQLIFRAARKGARLESFKAQYPQLSDKVLNQIWTELSEQK